MAREVYVDGRYEPYHRARVHCEDRGNQFGDAVYEVIEVRNGALIDEDRHIARLSRSLGELSIHQPMSAVAWSVVLRETVRRNRVRDGIVYLQVSRGAAPRDFMFPAPSTPPTVICLARSVAKQAGDAKAQAGIRVISRPDPRWARCDIKTVMLLPASLAKEEARANGAEEVWFTDQAGYVTEGGSSNAWILTPERKLVTTPVSNAILKGVTRMTLMDLIVRDGIELEERRFTIDEAQAAHEAFVTSASNLVMPVIAIDGQPVANGQPGQLAGRLRGAFHEVAQAS